MPSFETFKKNNTFPTSGAVRKDNSDKIVEASWWEDICAKKAYLYDYYHDSEPTKMRGLAPEDDELKVEVDIKLIQHTTQTYGKDDISYHLMFKPSYQCALDYYEAEYGKRYGATHPVGCYIDIPDEKGVFNKWLIVGTANYYGNQFPDYDILPCNKIFQYVYNHQKHEVAGVLRSVSATNGLKDYTYVQDVTDKQKILLPLNRDTERLYYNQRAIIDAPVLTTPRCWKISAVDRVSPVGIVNITFDQDLYDASRDYIETNASGDVIGMWANYCDVEEPHDNPDVPAELEPYESEITYTGKNTLSLGSSLTKLLTAKFIRNAEDINLPIGDWTFCVDDEDVAELLDITIKEEDNRVAEIKFNKVDTAIRAKYFGKKLNVSYQSANYVANLTLDIKS